MTENSKIEWTDHTFNPWIGCQKVSPGCEHCYAEAFARRYGKAEWGPTAQRVRTSAANWQKPLRWNREQWEQCADCGWRGPTSETHDFCPSCDGEDLRHTRQRVFCASLADVFENNRQLDEWRMDLFRLIVATPNLDWLLLTKRPEHIRALAPADWNMLGYPANVWVGTSVENQKQAEKRIPVLLSVPARVRFLSCEPLLGRLDLSEYLTPCYAADDPRHEPWRNGVDWVIVGGESGPHARPISENWVRQIRDDCAAYGRIPFLFKQWGQFVPAGQAADWYNSGEPMYAADGETITRSIRLKSKHAAGRMLDGREWNETPAQKGLL